MAKPNFKIDEPPVVYDDPLMGDVSSKPSGSSRRPLSTRSGILGAFGRFSGTWMG